MHIVLTGDWAKLIARYKSTAGGMHGAIEKALHQEGEFYVKKIVNGIESKAPAGKPFIPLKQSTINTRKALGFRSAKPLKESKDLINSVGYKVRDYVLFVGVLAESRRKDGKDAVKLANIHEFGHGPILIKVTPAMRAFLAINVFKNDLQQTKNKKSGTGVIVVNIPARPFLGPIYERYAEGTGVKRLYGRIIENLRV